MKHIIYIFILLFTVFTISCDDSFLEENKKQIDGYDLDAPLYVQPVSDYTEAFVTLPDLKNKDFKVFQYPKIIHFETFDGHIDETGKLTFRIKVDPYDNPVKLEPQNLGNIILNVDDFGLLSIRVQSINWGTPKASVRENLIDFDLSRNRKELKLENYANGILLYKLSQKPSWVEVSRSSWGDDFIKTDDINYVEQNVYTTLSVVPKVEGLSPGVREGEIIFETSDPNNPIIKVNVKIRIRTYENSEAIVPIDGVVMDAEFDKNTNTAIIITQNPAKLILYNTDTKVKKEKVLDKSPYSIDLSSDGKTILLGESGQMEIIELNTLNTKEKITTSYIIYDIVDGENNFYYFTNNNYELFSFNKTTKEIKKQTVIRPEYNNEITGNIVTKIKNKPHLLFSSFGIASYGLALIDTSTPDDLGYINYWHDSFESKILVSEDNKYMFAGMSYVYGLPNENSGSTLYVLGMLEDKDKKDFIRFDWIHHSLASNSVWGAYKYYDNETYRYKGRLIEFADNTFDERRKIELNEYVTTINGKKDYYGTIAPYFFATANGNDLLLVKNIVEYNANAWHLEVIDVSK